MPFLTSYMIAMTWPMQASAAFWTSFARHWPATAADLMAPMVLTEMTEAAAAGAAAVAKGTPIKPRAKAA